MSQEKPNPGIKMPKRKFHKTRKICGVSVKLFLEIFLVSLMLLLIAAGALIYNLSKDNLDIEFVREHLEETINAEIAPNKISVGELDINWVNIFDRPVFEISDFSFLNVNDEELLSFEDLTFTLSRSKMLIGEFLPREIIARGVDLHFVKKEDGAVQLGFVAGPSLKIYQPGDGDGEAFDISLDQLHQTYLQPVFEAGFLRGLKKLEILNSAVVFEDIPKNYALSFPDINAIFKPDEKRYALNLDMQVQNGKDRDLLQLGLLYDVNFDELQTSLATQNFNPFLWASLFDFDSINAENSHVKIDSQIQATFDNRLNFQGVEVQSETLSGVLDIPILYDQPVEFERLALNGFFNRSTLTFDLKQSILQAYGVKIDLDGSVPLFFDKVEAYDIPLEFRIEEFNVPIPEKAFPDRFEDKPLYEWLTQKLEKGTVKNLKMALDLSVLKTDEASEPQWKGKIKKLLGSFDFEDVTAIYKSTMVPVSNVSGRAVIDSVPDTFTVIAETGNLDDLNLRNIDLEITDVLKKKKGIMDLTFNMNGKLKDGFAFLAREPISLDKKIKFDRKLVQGDADLLINIIKSTRKNVPLEEIKIDVTGTLKNLLIPKLVKDMDISADVMNFSVKDMLMRANGIGRIAGREGVFNWQQYMKADGKPFKMKVDANLLSDVNLRQQFGVKLDQFLTGQVGLDLKYISQPDNSARVSVTADLTPAQLHFDALGYQKPSGEKASALLDLNLANNKLASVNGLSLQAPQLDIKNASLTFNNGALKEGHFKQTKIGESDISVHLINETPQRMKLDIKGQRFDARPLLGNKEKKDYSGPAINAFMEVDEILTHEDEKITQSKVFFSRTTNGDIAQFEMDGKSGDGNVYVRYKPGADGRPELNAEFSDAGAALRALGLYKNLRGGRMIISGTSSDQVWAGNINGRFLLQDFSVRNAPVLAKLINAMSLTGIGQLLNNDGVVFSRLGADFKWTTRPDGALIRVRDGRTSGSELGLTFEGTIDRATQTLNMDGTIVPASTLNNLIGDIPLLGPLITGGTGALIAATYTIKGPYKNPEVRINPLSALAPGIVRKILFED